MWFENIVVFEFRHFAAGTRQAVENTGFGDDILGHLFGLVAGIRGNEVMDEPEVGYNTTRLHSTLDYMSAYDYAVKLEQAA